MTDPIEQRLLRLAEAAAEEWPVTGGIPVGEIDDETGTARLGERTADLIIELSAPLVTRLARVVGAMRTLLDNLSLRGCCPATNCDSEDPTGLDGLREPEPHSEGCAWVAAREAYRALDADAPQKGKR